MKLSKSLFTSCLLLIACLLLTSCETFKATPVGGVLTGRNETVADYLGEVEDENEEHYDEAGPVDEYETIFEDDGTDEYRL